MGSGRSGAELQKKEFRQACRRKESHSVASGSLNIYAGSAETPFPDCHFVERFTPHPALAPPSECSVSPKANDAIADYYY